MHNIPINLQKGNSRLFSKFLKDVYGFIFYWVKFQQIYEAQLGVVHLNNH